MKQKIVIQVLMNHDKCRSKALKIAVSIPGVERAALTGQEKDHVEVEGDGIDSVELTRRLRKNVAHAVLVSVGEVKKPAPPTQPPMVAPLCCHSYPPCHWCEVVEPNIYGPPCTIM